MSKYKYIGPNKVVFDSDGNKSEEAANCYGGNKLKTGDMVELNDYLSSKANSNPNYEKVKSGSKPKAPKETPKEVREQVFGVSAKDKQLKLTD